MERRPRRRESASRGEQTQSPRRFQTHTEHVEEGDETAGQVGSKMGMRSTGQRGRIHGNCEIGEKRRNDQVFASVGGITAALWRTISTPSALPPRTWIRAARHRLLTLQAADARHASAQHGIKPPTCIQMLPRDSRSHNQL